MYIARVLTKTSRGKVSHICYLLRESYRKKGKVKTKTIANITHMNEGSRRALEFALQNPSLIREPGACIDDVKLTQGMSVGAVYTVYEIAKRLGIAKALGNDRTGKLGLWQVIARVIHQGSRLGAVRLASVHNAPDVLAIREEFNEDDLYTNLGKLSERQEGIEKRLFTMHYEGKKEPKLFLYDVTSSYFEGEANELAEYGYNRDGKKHKKQVVLGLLSDEEGNPVAIEVFKGNTNDFKTVGEQVKKLTARFGCKGVTFVGDRGMIKADQIESLDAEEFYYITAITKAQVKKLVRTGVFQMDCFDKDLCEREDKGIRYILRRNPYRAEEIAETRQKKRKKVEELCKAKNIYLAEHRRAKLGSAQKELEKVMVKLRIEKWLKVKASEEKRELFLETDENALREEAQLDGCYVLKSNVPKDVDAKTIHDRYKDLSKVEYAFKQCKTEMLEMRPWYVRLERNTRGHALIVMLAYSIIRYLEEAWREYNVTVREGLERLALICSQEVHVGGSKSCHMIPRPDGINEKLLTSLDITLPKVLPNFGVSVGTRKKLQKERKAH